MSTSKGNAWRGRALVQLGYAAFVGHVGDNRLHRHYAVQIVIASKGRAGLQWKERGLFEAGVLICPANVAHRLIPSEEPVALIYLEPTTALGSFAQTRFCHDPVAKADGATFFGRLEGAVAQASPERIQGVIQELLHFTVPNAPKPADSRVRRILDSAAFPMVPPPLVEAAAMASLSPSRFSHLFVQEMDIAYRAFSKWRKLMLALQAIARGADLTGAAHEGGFADSAHFSRTFVSMFGIPPRLALARLRFQRR